MTFGKIVELGCALRFIVIWGIFGLFIFGLELDPPTRALLIVLYMLVWAVTVWQWRGGKIHLPPGALRKILAVVLAVILGGAGIFELSSVTAGRLGGLILGGSLLLLAFGILGEELTRKQQPVAQPAERGYVEGGPEVSVSDSGVLFRRAPGDILFVCWNELREVIVETIGAPDAWKVLWILVSDLGEAVVSMDEVKGADMLQARLMALDGFDKDAFMDVMTSYENARNVCWERKPVEAS